MITGSLIIPTLSQHESMIKSHKTTGISKEELEQRPENASVSSKFRQRRLIINVGGTRFETYNSTLLRFPGTRLARLAKSAEADEAYDAAAGEFFFDRSPAMFALLLDYYRSGELHINAGICGSHIRAELDFWKLEEMDIEACCWSKYTHSTDSREALAQIDRVLHASRDYSAEWVRAAGSTFLRARRYVWRSFEDPSASLFAKFLLVVSIVAIVVSVRSFIPIPKNFLFIYSDSITE